jgi:3-deoxy-manno-octulosonate cytidylyltransferase (CMP-KDO synthetase)
MIFHVIIPARMASTRLPNKPLADIAGVPMVVRVAQQAALSLAQSVTVAADDERIVEACQQHGISAILTATNHESGTARLAEAALLLGFGEEDLVVNVQGDEPLIDPKCINLVAELLSRHKAPMATLAHRIHTIEEVFNPNVVKVVVNKKQEAMMFSRAPIPYARDSFSEHPVLPQGVVYLRHIGLYAYRVGFLYQYITLSPSPIESVEALEQLRVLWYGYAISVGTVDAAPLAGVDTPEDLARVRATFLT